MAECKQCCQAGAGPAMVRISQWIYACGRCLKQDGFGGWIRRSIIDAHAHPQTHPPRQVFNPQTHPPSSTIHTHNPTQYARAVLECDDFFLKFLEPFKRLRASDEAKAWVAGGALAFEVSGVFVWKYGWISEISVDLPFRLVSIQVHTATIPTHTKTKQNRSRRASARACTSSPPGRRRSRARRSAWRRGPPRACSSSCWTACPPLLPRRAAAATRRRGMAAPDRTRSCKLWGWI